MIKKKVDADRGKQRTADLIGVDFGSTGTKVVRLKRAKERISLVAMDLLPAVDFSVAASRMQLPRNISTYYGCLAYTAPSAVVRVVNTRLDAEQNALEEAKLRGLLNVGDEFRVSSRLLARGRGRADSSFLAAAIPDDDARFLISMFPAGPPAPASLEVSGLAAINAFLQARGRESENAPVCFFEAGESLCHFAFLRGTEISLVGKIPFGARALRNKLALDLGVDDDLAESILKDRSINIAGSLVKILEPALKQLSISKDFIERHQSCRVSRVYCSGGLSLLNVFSEQIGGLLGCEVVPWNPLEGLEGELDLADALKAEAPRYSAAIGAALGGFEQS